MKADVVVVGAGHNGLVAAAYLARAGLVTRVVERRHVLGGAAVTEDLWPGYRVSRASYVAGLLRPCVVKELGLERRGLRLLRRRPASFTPLPDGGDLLLGGGAESDHASIARFSKRDAERYVEYEAFLDRIARMLEPLLDRAPPDPSRPRLRDLAPLFRLARQALRNRGDLPEALALLTGAARPALERWFESEPLRATLATDAVIGAWAPPSAPGTGYVLFHHVMGETYGERGVWAYVEGGMGGLSESLARAARDAGATLQLEAPVRSIDTDAGRVAGITLEDGTFIDARMVVSSADPRRTLELAGAGAFPADYARGIESLDFRSGSMKINLALDRLPRFRGREGVGALPGPEHHGTIHVGATDLDAIEEAFRCAERGHLAERPIVELTLPSAVDATLAPAGHHVASMFVQWAPYRLAEGTWEVGRDVAARRAFALMDEVAPGFSDSVLHHEVLAPPDIERIFGLTGGNIFHGAMSLDRLAFMRPLPGATGYRTPLEGLWLCGAGTHPGGGVMGACGRNAAREILRERRLL